ncbi:MAG: hypothetical protein AAF513_16200 [Pseudomonadota bacterium]
MNCTHLARWGTALLLLVSTASIYGASITLDLVRQNSNNSFQSLMVDQTSGQYYERTSFQGGSNIKVFADQAAFAAGAVSNTVSILGQTHMGTYAIVENGSLFGRSTTNTTEFSRWDFNSGLKTSQTALTGFDPRNGGSSGSFNWGGYSALNAMDSGTTKLVVGGDGASPRMRIETIDSNLNSSLAGFVNGKNYGYGFAIGNYVFLGDSYNSNQISVRFNILTGMQEAVNFTLTGGGSNSYWSNVVYDAVNNMLTFWNTSNRTYFSVSNASQTFGVPQPNMASVSEPGILGLLGIALLALGRLRRRATV